MFYPATDIGQADIAFAEPFRAQDIFKAPAIAVSDTMGTTNATLSINTRTALAKVVTNVDTVDATATYKGNQTLRSFAAAVKQFDYVVKSLPHIVFAGGRVVDLDFSGKFVKDNDKLIFAIVIDTYRKIRIFSSSWWRQGFDPILSIWKKTGELVYEQDDGSIIGQTSSDGVMYNHGNWDSYYDVMVDPGEYYVVITQYSNFANGNNISDGWNYDYEPHFTRVLNFGTQPDFNGVLNNDDRRLDFWEFHLLNVSAAIIVASADFIPVPQRGMPPIAIEFINLSIDAISFSWSFGDGGISSDESPVHVYSRTGRYTVTLTVTGEFGSDTVAKEIFVMRHYYAMRKLFPVQFAGDHDAMLMAEGAFLDRAENFIGDAFAELFPENATPENLLPSFERVYEIVPAPGETTEQRRVSVLAAYSSDGGISKPFFEAIARALGYEIGTREAVGDPHLYIVTDAYLPWRAGISRAGIDLVWDQVAGGSQWTWDVYGTGVQSDDRLNELFTSFKPPFTEVQFIDD